MTHAPERAPLRDGGGLRRQRAHRLLLPQLGIEIGHDDRGDRHQHDDGAGRADRHLVAREGVGVHEGRRQLRRVAGPAAGQRDHQVVGS